MVVSLDLKDQERLVTAIMQVQDVHRRANRDLYVKALEGELGDPLSLDRFDQTKHDVWGLVGACLGRLGGVHALVDVLESFHGHSRPVAMLRELLAELLPDPLLTSAERRELGELLAALENGGLNPISLIALPGLYWHAVGPAGPAPSPSVRTVHDLAACLEEAIEGADSVPPLLVYTAGLAGLAEGATGPALWDWSRRFAGRLGIDHSVLDRLRTESTGGRSAPDEPTYLVVECRPDAFEANRFFITAWLQIGSSPGITLIREDGAQPVSRLPTILQTLLTEHPAVINRANPELTIEFVVSRELLDHPFDQIKINIDGLERRLGIDHPVVLRSLNRLSRPTLHHRWRRKWAQLRDAPAGAQIHWVAEPGELDHEYLYTLLLEPSSAVLAMAFPGGRAAGPVDELWIGLQAGIPILAWCRQGTDPARFRAETGRLLEDDLLTLPQRVHGLRRAAVLSGSIATPHGGPVGSGEPVGARAAGCQVAARQRAGEGRGDGEQATGHLGLRLSLIFDDADRIPEPYLRLKAPI